MMAKKGTQADRMGYWAGLPPADELERLDKLHPGLAERSFGIVEKEQAHQHLLRWVGLWSSLGFGLITLVASIVLIVNGHVAGGVGTAGAWGIGSAGVFATSRLPYRNRGMAEAPQSTASLPPATQ